MEVKQYVGNEYNIDVYAPLIGMELELEGLGRSNLGAYERFLSDSDAVLRALQEAWQYLEDGSLRNGGIEFIFRRPLPLNEASEAIDRITELRERLGLVSSIRTSTHVHVNVLGFTLDRLTAACMTYCLLEPLLYKFCGPRREDNIYCIPWYRASQQDCIRRAYELSRNSTDYRVFLPFGEGCKYSGLNIRTVSSLGTLEFRQAPSFEDPEKMKLWAGVCCNIVYAPWHSPEEVLEAWDTLGPRNFALQVLGPQALSFIEDETGERIEHLAEEYDVLSTAEFCMPDPPPTDAGWRMLSTGIQGEGTTGYARTVQGLHRYNLLDDYPMGDPEEEYDEMYEDEEEEY